MDESERQRVEEEIRAEAKQIALALADHPEFAIDIRDILGEQLGEISTRDDLDDLYGIGTADDHQQDADSADYRRCRRLGELKLALDEVRGSRW